MNIERALKMVWQHKETAELVSKAIEIGFANGIHYIAPAERRGTYRIDYDSGKCADGLSFTKLWKRLKKYIQEGCEQPLPHKIRDLGLALEVKVWGEVGEVELVKGQAIADAYEECKADYCDCCDEGRIWDEEDDEWYECGCQECDGLNSCMAGKSELLDVYVQNEGTIGMAILRVHGDIVARCITWNVDGQRYFDRIYYECDRRETELALWLEDRGYESIVNQLVCVMVDNDGELWPYMDNMQYVSHVEGNTYKLSTNNPLTIDVERATSTEGELHKCNKQCHVCGVVKYTCDLGHAVDEHGNSVHVCKDLSCTDEFVKDYFTCKLIPIGEAVAFNKAYDSSPRWTTQEKASSMLDDRSLWSGEVVNNVCHECGCVARIGYECDMCGCLCREEAEATATSRDPEIKWYATETGVSNA